MDNNGIQATPNLVRAILAPILQPGAQLGQTQAEIPSIQQSTATSGQEQQNLQAQNPGEQAQSTTQQVQATQNAASLLAGKASETGMIPVKIFPPVEGVCVPVGVDNPKSL